MNSSATAFVNGTLDPIGPKVKYSTPQQVLIGLSLSLISIITIVGNGLVIFVYRKLKRVAKEKSFFILSLACADIIIGIFSVNVYIMYILRGYWPFGPAFCQVWLLLDHCIFTVSNFTLVAIAVDRFLAVCFPMKHRTLHMNYSYVKRAVRIVWTVSFLVWAPAMLLFTNQIWYNVRIKRQCDIRFCTSNVGLIITIVCFSYLLPVFILTLSYICIFHMLIKRYKQINLLHGHTELMLDNDCVLELTSVKESNVSFDVSMDIPSEGESLIWKNGSLPKHAAESKKNKSKKKHSKYYSRSLSVRARKKVIRDTHQSIGFLVFVTISFILAWLPYHFVIAFISMTYTTFSEHLWRFCFIIGWMSSAVNPFFYALGDFQFRRSFKKILSQKLKRN